MKDTGCCTGKTSTVLSILLILASFTVLVNLNSCSQAEKQTQTEKQEKNYEANAALVLNVDGMTCAKGCAKLIEGAFAKKDGVTDCEVSFDEKQATIQFNDQYTSEEEIIKYFSKIADGAYTPSKIEEANNEENSSL